MKTQKSKSKIAILMGGIGSEREISLQSGNCVADALEQAGFEVVRFDIRPDKLEILDDSTIDIFFPVLHGEFGEDGRLQQILEDKSLVYVGSGPEACRLALDKMASKELFLKVDITTPAAIEFHPDMDIEQFVKQLDLLAKQYVVKPIRQGSSVGVTITNDSQKAIAEAQKCFSEFGDCMIEELVPGRDITIGILCDQALPIIELKTQTGYYDYHAKYFDKQTEFLFHTITNPEVTARAKKAALDCYYALGCRHFARVDFRLDTNGTAYALELNAIPGFTNRSDLPKAAEEAGLSMSDLCRKIVETACLSLTTKTNIT